MSTRIRTAVTAAALAAVLASASGCAAAPTTTHTNASGQEVSVDWRDYPVHAYTLPEDLMLAPVKEDVAEVSATMLTEIKAALGCEFNFQWTARGEQGWYPSTGNGYGGAKA